MSVKNTSFFLASLALLSLCFNFHKRVFTADKTLRCARELHATRRHTTLVQARLTKTVATLAELNQTIAELTAGKDPADTAANGPDIEDLVAKIRSREKTNKGMNEYLLKLQNKTNEAEHEASLHEKTAKKLTDEIKNLKDEFTRLRQELMAAVRTDMQ